MPEWLLPAMLAISTLFTLGSLLRLLTMVRRVPMRFAGPADPLPAAPRHMALPRPLRDATRVVGVAVAANAALALLLATG